MRRSREAAGGPRIAPEVVRQAINDGEIGGEMHDSVLIRHLRRGDPHADSDMEAAIAIHEALVAGYIKPGFWDACNWAPAWPERSSRGL